VKKENRPNFGKVSAALFFKTHSAFMIFCVSSQHEGAQQNWKTTKVK